MMSSMSTRLTLLLALACGCSEPILKNVPQPPTATAAGVGAAAAAAATLAAPDAAARRAEEAKKAGAPPPRGVESHEPMPAGVLERLETAPDGGAAAGPPVDAGVDAAPPPSEPFVPTTPFGKPKR